LKKPIENNSDNKCALNQILSRNDYTFTAREFLEIMGYVSSTIFEAVQATLNRHSKEEFDEISVRMLRKFLRMLAYPKLVLQELEIENEGETIQYLTFQQREIFYNVLGNHSLQVKSLTDIELITQTFTQLKDY